LNETFFTKYKFLVRWRDWKGSCKRAEFFQPAAGSSTCGNENRDRI